MIIQILTPDQAFEIIDQGGWYELGVHSAHKVGFRSQISFIELAAVKLPGSDEEMAVWVSRDENADCVDYLTEADAQQAIAEGYSAGWE